MTTKRCETSLGVSWMEHQVLEHVKEALRTTVNWRAPSVSLSRKLSSVRFTLKSFQRHLERLMNLEEEGGYLGVVAETKPNLHHRVELLAGDHDRFRRRVREIIPQVENIHEWQQADFEQACQDIRELLDEVDRHDAEEVYLLQESLLCDEGGEG